MSVERAKHLVDALTNMEKWRGKPASMRKRRFKRFGVRGTGMLMQSSLLVTGEKQALLSIQLRDMSRGGIGFLHDEPLRVDSSHRLLLVEQELVIAALPLFVRYCQQIEKNAYLIGAEFGVEAAILAAMGVPSRKILANDVPEDSMEAVDEVDFVDPDQIEAA